MSAPQKAGRRGVKVLERLSVISKRHFENVMGNYPSMNIKTMERQ